MTQIVEEYRVRIHDKGTTDPVLGTVDFTVDENHLADVPVFPSQYIELYRGNVETRSGEFLVLDTADWFTALVADSDGYPDLGRRLAEFQTNRDGAGWTTRAVGRISDVALDPTVSAWRVRVLDERWIESELRILTEQAGTLGSGTAANYTHCRVLPVGIIGAYGPYGVGVQANPRAFATQVGNYVWLALDRLEGTDVAGLANIRHAHMCQAMRGIVDAIDNDLLDSHIIDTAGSGGSYEHLRANVDGTDREVLGISRVPQQSLFHGPHNVLFDSLAGKYEGDFSVLVHWPTYTSGTPSSVYLHMPTAEPTPFLPKLIGGAEGIHPFELRKDILDEYDLRYDSTALQALIDDPRYGHIRLMIDGPATHEGFAYKRLDRPYQCAALHAADGASLLKAMSLEQNLDHTSLYEFTSTKIGEPHPTLAIEGAEQVTVCEFTYQTEEMVPLNWIALLEIPERWKGFNAALLKVEDVPFEIESSKVSEYGRHTQNYDIRGLHKRHVRIPLTNRTILAGSAQLKALWIAREVFEVAADGATRGVITGLSDSSSVDNGDPVKVTLASFPNLSTQARGGSQVFRVLSSRYRIASGTPFVYDVIRLGPASQPPSAPTVAATATGKHSIDVQISGLDAGTGYQLEFAMNSSEPGATSGLWEFVADGDGNETISIDALPSGTKFYFRALATAPNRFRSDWSASDNATTTALTAPSSLSDSATTGTTSPHSWTNGEADYGIEVLLDEAACAGASHTRIASLEAGATEFEFIGLTLSTMHCAAVRHFDPYGGVSALATNEFTTTGTKPDCPEPAGIMTL
jgi:hypothetical protein